MIGLNYRTKRPEDELNLFSGSSVLFAGELNHSLLFILLKFTSAVKILHVCFSEVIKQEHCIISIIVAVYHLCRFGTGERPNPRKPVRFTHEVLSIYSMSSSYADLKLICRI